MKNKKAIGRPAETKAGAWPGGRTTPPNAAPGLSESEVIALVEQCAGDLRGFFRRRGVAPADCEDLAQEALLVVWNLRERVREGKGRPFLFAIAYRRLLAYRRKQARRAAVLLPGPPEEGAEARPENGNAALQFMQLLDREATGRLGAALAQLPERQREVIQYVYFGGDTLADAANKLHIQAQTAGIHHQRALKRLRELLMEEGGGGMIPKGCDMIGKKNS